jgi:hypothetical protein
MPCEFCAHPLGERIACTHEEAPPVLKQIRGHIKVRYGRIQFCRLGNTLRPPRTIQTLRANYPRLFEIAVSIVIGGLIQFVILTFHPPTLQFARRAADDAADQMIRLAEQTSSQLQRSTAYTLITVDDATYNAWGIASSHTA